MRGCMKKLVKLILLITLFTLVGCGSSTNTKESNDNKITIAVRPYPYADITEQAKSKLKEEGIDLEVVVFDEANQANDALRDGSVDANYIQHKQYLDSIADEKGYDFEAVANVHIEPIGFYSEKIKSIDDLKEGSVIAVPDNASNEYRSFLLLEKYGLIKLGKSASNKTVSVNNIVENPKKLVIKEVDSYQLPRVLQDVDGAVINTAIILEAGIDPKTAIIKEDSNSPYSNIVAVRKEDKDNEKIKKLAEAIQSDEVREFIKKKYDGSVIPAF